MAYNSERDRERGRKKKYSHPASGAKAGNAGNAKAVTAQEGRYQRFKLAFSKLLARLGTVNGVRVVKNGQGDERQIVWQKSIKQKLVT